MNLSLVPCIRLDDFFFVQIYQSVCHDIYWFKILRTTQSCPVIKVIKCDVWGTWKTRLQKWLQLAIFSTIGCVRRISIPFARQQIRPAHESSGNVQSPLRVKFAQHLSGRMAAIQCSQDERSFVIVRYADHTRSSERPLQFVERGSE